MNESIAEKVAHVKASGQTRDHDCHWPGCAEQVPPAKWGCTKHWFALPKELRDRIWAAYRSGQEATLTPSRAYIEAATAAQEWIRNRLPKAAKPPPPCPPLPVCDVQPCSDYPSYGLGKARRCLTHLWPDYREHLAVISGRRSAYGQGPDVATVPVVREPDVGVVNRPAQGKLL